MHMYDGDAMVHCVRIQGGEAKSYSNSYLESPRYLGNDKHQEELYATFGDLAMGG
jgi:carotenoid cleavage dioxygenase-like enzyme